MNRPLSEEWREAANKWVRADSVARLLEDTKSQVLAKRMADLGDIPVSRAELTIKATNEWRDYVERIVKARTDAEFAKVEMRYQEMRYWEGQSRAATERTEARL